MTALSNLCSILEHGLLSHNEAHRLKLVTMDISDPEVNCGIRANKKDTIHNQPLHDYVPLYFSPRNPMLFKRRELQKKLVILGINPQLIIESSTVFSDGNAASKDTNFYNDVAMLDNLPWNVINAPSWSDFPAGRRIKCAEVLVYPKIQAKSILSIFCYSGRQLSTVHEIIRSIIAIPRSITISVQVNSKLFF
jgi:hypothetical protein